MRRIVVLGGGAAGLSAARKLSDELRSRTRIEITLVTDQAYFVKPTGLPQVAAGTLALADASVPIRKVLDSRVQIEIDHVNSIDFERKQLLGQRRAYPFDYAVLAPGASSQSELTIGTPNDTMHVREHVLSCLRNAKQASDQRVRERELCFVVVGAGINGVEFSGNLAHVLKRQSTSTGASFRIVLVEAQSRILPRMPESMSKAVEQCLHDLGVEITVGQQIKETTSTDVTLTDGRTLQTGNVIWCIGQTPHPWFAQQDLDTDGRPCVNRYLELINHGGIYVAGDAAGVGPDVPWSAKIAVSQGRRAARNLVAQIGGRSRKAWSTPSSFHGVILTPTSAVCLSEQTILKGIAARSRISVEDSKILPFAFGKRRWVTEILQNSLKVFDRTERAMLTED